MPSCWVDRLMPIKSNKAMTSTLNARWFYRHILYNLWSFFKIQTFYFIKVMAFPSVNKVSWLKNGEVIRPSRQAGIIIANYSLVLQNVRLNDAGFYSCQAENHIGATESNKVELKIKCKYFLWRYLARFGSVFLPSLDDLFGTFLLPLYSFKGFLCKIFFSGVYDLC